jgi:8-oxo-dGTP diphosphatase
MRERIQCLIIRENKILFVNDKYADHYYPPGGKIDEGENHEDTLRRELDEEIGVKVNWFKFVLYYDVENVILKVPQREHTYIVDIEGDPIPSNEIRDAAWVSWDDIVNKKYDIPEPLYENILVKLKKYGLL